MPFCCKTAHQSKIPILVVGSPYKYICVLFPFLHYTSYTQAILSLVQELICSAASGFQRTLFVTPGLQKDINLWYHSVVRLAIDLMSPDLKFGRADRKVHVSRVHANLLDFET